MSAPLDLDLLPGRYAFARLPPAAPLPAWFTAAAGLRSCTWAKGETSLLCLQSAVPVQVRAERDYCALGVRGPLDHALVGVLLSLLQPLATAGISVCALSTFDTDLLLVREQALEPAIAALRQAGHRVFA